MARYYFSSKSTVEGYTKTLSIFNFKRDKFLEKGVTHNAGTSSWTLDGEPNGSIGIEINRTEFEGTLRVQFTQTDRNTDEKKDFDYTIRLTTTQCHIGGGRRWWFVCPCQHNRCAKLYLQSNGIFASRKTLNLSYASRNKSKYWRYLESVFGAGDMELLELRKKIHYPYRNGRPTRKMKKYLKMSSSPFTDEQLARMECELLNSGKRQVKWG